jgi:hypothetical protein
MRYLPVIALVLSGKQDSRSDDLGRLPSFATQTSAMPYAPLGGSHKVAGVGSRWLANDGTQNEGTAQYTPIALVPV